MATTTPTKSTFRTEPFTCPSCVTKIESVIGRTKGVADVSVKFNSNRVVVNHDPEVAPAQMLAEKIAGLGYPVVSTR